MNKIFKGYYCVGAGSKEAAAEGKGLTLWSQETPSKLVQFFNRILLNIYWISEERVQKERGASLQKKGDTQIKKNNMPDKR